MININDSTVAVENEADLREAVSSNNGIDYVYLAVDINLTSGITIYAGSGKPSLTIDGLYREVMHRFTDMNSDFPTSTIGIGSASNMNLTFQNMIITGRNFYGIPYVYGLAATQNLSITYNNVTYTGPQLVYNWNGLTRFINCDITIQQNGVSEAQEVGEVNRVVFDGTIRIAHNSTNTDRAVFYFHGNASTAAFTVLPGADVMITTKNSYFMYNTGIFDVPIPVPYTIGSGASFTLNANKGISYKSNHQLASLLVDENASFRCVQTSNNATTATLYINGALTVNKGASFYMQAYDNTAQLIWFTNNAACRIAVNNPKSFVVYSRNAAAFNFAASTSFSLSGGQLNYWPAAKMPMEEAGKFTDVPQHKWFKKDYAILLELGGTAAQTTTSVASNNITQADQPLPALGDLHLHDARVLSIGNLPLSVNPVVDDQTPITGTTAPYADVLVEYTIDGVSRSRTATADLDGRFSVLTQESIPYTTSVKISVNLPFLIRELSTDSQKAGELFIDDAPTLIRFITPPISLSPLLLRRNTPVIPVKVIDTRVYSTQWNLAASIDGPMHAQSGHTLPNAVVYVDDSTMQPLDSVVLTRVFVGGPDVPVTNVTWNEDKGILLHVTAPLHNKEEYTARLVWTVYPAK